MPAVIPETIKSKVISQWLLGLKREVIAEYVLEYVKELSTPGKMCIYHVDISSQPGGKAGIITDIALQNPTATDVKFPPMSALVIGVDAIAPGAETGGNMTMGGNMTK